jgi:hypothetical protein
MRSRWLSTVLAGGVSALLLGWVVQAAVASGHGSTYGESMTSVARSGSFVTYRQEGGIGGPRPSLVVSTDRGARVTLGSCAASFTLRPGSWRNLRAAVEGARVRGLAGTYPPPAGSADVITYVVRTRAGTVRIAPAPEPRNEEVMRDLGPLFKVLNGLVSAGERRMPTSCPGSR